MLMSDTDSSCLEQIGKHTLPCKFFYFVEKKDEAVWILEQQINDCITVILCRVQ